MIALNTTARAPRFGAADPARQATSSLPSGWWLLPAVVLSLAIWGAGALVLIQSL